MGAVLGSILPLRLVVAVVIHVVWHQLSALSSLLVARIPPMCVALPWWRHRNSKADLLHWNVRVQLLRDPCPPYHLRWMSPMASPSCLFYVSDSDEVHMHGMVEVTLVPGGEESLEDPASNVVACQQVSFTTSEFPIRRNMRSYSLPSQWAYMLREYGASSGTFRLPAVGSTAVVEAPIDWGTLEASKRCESLAASPHGRQVATVIPQMPMPGPGRPLLGRGTLLLLNQRHRRRRQRWHLCGR